MYLKGLSIVVGASILSACALPSGGVVAFDLQKCPSGWSEYENAYGRFVRGIDRSGQGIDVDGQRLPGDVQSDENKKHDHAFSGSAVTKGGNGGTGRVLAVGDGANFGTYVPGGSISKNGVESRPKNVALLYCVKG